MDSQLTFQALMFMMPLIQQLLQLHSGYVLDILQYTKVLIRFFKG
jgi:hypothetical protein